MEKRQSTVVLILLTTLQTTATGNSYKVKICANDTEPTEIQCQYPSVIKITNYPEQAYVGYRNVCQDPNETVQNEEPTIIPEIRCNGKRICLLDSDLSKSYVRLCECYTNMMVFYYDCVDLIETSTEISNLSQSAEDIDLEGEVYTTVVVTVSTTAIASKEFSSNNVSGAELAGILSAMLLVMGIVCAMITYFISKRQRKKYTSKLQEIQHSLLRGNLGTSRVQSDVRVSNVYNEITSLNLGDSMYRASSITEYSDAWSVTSSVTVQESITHEEDNVYQNDCTKRVASESSEIDYFCQEDVHSNKNYNNYYQGNDRTVISGEMFIYDSTNNTSTLSAERDQQGSSEESDEFPCTSTETDETIITDNDSLYNARTPMQSNIPQNEHEEDNESHKT